MIDTIEHNFDIIAVLFVVVMFLYPAVVACIGYMFARIRKPHFVSNDSVSLIVPAHNEESVIRRKMENVLAVEAPADVFEVLVASDGSVDGTVGIAREFEGSRVRVLEFRERRGKASVLNDAVAQAQGELLCLCDANVMFHPDAVTKLARHFADPKVGAVTGEVRLASHESDFGEGESFYYKIERAIQLGESRLGAVMGVDGGMYMIRKSLFPQLPASTILDDFVVTMRVIQQGYKVLYDPEAIATENGTPTSAQEFKRRVRVSAGAMQVLARGEFPSVLRQPIAFLMFVFHKALRWFSPVWLVVLFVTNLLLLQSGLFYQLTMAAQLLVYGLAFSAWLSLRFRNTRLGGIPYYFTLSQVAMAMGIVKGIFNLQRVTWDRTERQATGDLASLATVEEPVDEAPGRAE